MSFSRTVFLLACRSAPLVLAGYAAAPYNTTSSHTVNEADSGSSSYKQAYDSQVNGSGKDSYHKHSADPQVNGAGYPAALYTDSAFKVNGADSDSYNKKAYGSHVNAVKNDSYGKYPADPQVDADNSYPTPAVTVYGADSDASSYNPTPAATVYGTDSDADSKKATYPQANVDTSGSYKPVTDSDSYSKKATYPQANVDTSGSYKSVTDDKVDTRGYGIEKIPEKKATRTGSGPSTFSSANEMMPCIMLLVAIWFLNNE